jgi:hypothetical protein
MPAFAAFCAAWSLTWAAWHFCTAGALPERWLDAIDSSIYHTAGLFAVNALACFLGMLAALAVT